MRENSPALKSQAELLKIAEKNVDSAFGGLLPRLDLVSSLEQDHNDRDINEGKSSSGSLGLTANIYRSHLDWHQYKIAKDQREIASLAYQRDLGDLLLRAIRSYLDYSVKAVELEIAKERKRLVDDQYSSSRKSYRSGTRTRLDFLRLEAEKLSSDFSVDRSQSEVVKALSLLHSFIKGEEDTPQFKPIVFDKSFAPGPVVLTATPDTHFEYRIEQIQAQIADIEVRKAHRNYWPNVDLTTRMSRSVTDFWGPSNETWESDWATTLNFSFNLFDGGILSSQVSNRKSELIIQENSRQMVELELKSRLIQIKEDSERLRQQVQVAQNVLNIETQVYSAVSREYRVGNIGYLDFINSLNKLLSARQNFQAAAADYVNTVYQIRYNNGELR